MKSSMADGVEIGNYDIFGMWINAKYIIEIKSAFSLLLEFNEGIYHSAISRHYVNGGGGGGS